MPCNYNREILYSERTLYKTNPWFKPKIRSNFGGSRKPDIISGI